MPDPPEPYGTLRTSLSGFVVPHSYFPPIADVPSLAVRGWIDNSGPVVVTFAPIDVRAGKVVPVQEFYLVART
jgi:hypothetical protein